MGSGTNLPSLARVDASHRIPDSAAPSTRCSATTCISPDVGFHTGTRRLPCPPALEAVARASKKVSHTPQSCTPIVPANQGRLSDRAQHEHNAASRRTQSMRATRTYEESTAGARCAPRPFEQRGRSSSLGCVEQAHAISGLERGMPGAVAAQLVRQYISCRSGLSGCWHMLDGAAGAVERPADLQDALGSRSVVAYPDDVVSRCELRRNAFAFAMRRVVLRCPMKQTIFAAVSNLLDCKYVAHLCLCESNTMPPARECA